ncbi:MAG: putative glycolipid-binding domain-containing protein [Rhodospirillales bacterium]|nr:MAG: putative glycolipid-binding domain-containing protein [Rhodospirillales bacterium]
MSHREFIWSDLNGPGMEHLLLAESGTGYVADGVYVGRNDDSPPYRVHYAIDISSDWEMRSATFRLISSLQPTDGIELSVNENCTWHDSNGQPIADLAGCHEIDLPCSPFSNSLVIRRLGLARGESAEISVACLELPQLSVKPVRQRYTCIEPLGEDGGVYRYEPLSRGPAHDLQVDPEGLVTDYPGAFRRVFAR